MKTIALITFTVLVVISCKSNEIVPTIDIVGRWSPTYITQRYQGNGTWEAWRKINTLVPLPIYEFTNDGQFLKDKKEEPSCCMTYDNTYSVSGNKILFKHSGNPVVLPNNCALVLCQSCPTGGWTIQEIKGDTMILEECGNVRNKFVRIK